MHNQNKLPYSKIRILRVKKALKSTHYFHLFFYRFYFLRLKDYTTDLNLLLEKNDIKNEEKRHNRTFPCAYCRTDISSSDCFTTGNKNEKNIFDCLLEKNIIELNLGNNG